MKSRTILWRPFNPHVSGKTGEPLPSPRSSHQWWGSFEKLLGAAFKACGDTLVTQPENVREPDKMESADLAVYAHRTMRDILSKTSYSYPRTARAPKRLFYMLMHLPGWFHMDDQGWGADHSRAGDPFDPDRVDGKKATQFTGALRDRLMGNNLSKHVQPPQEEAPAEGYALHCLQMPRDYTIAHHSKISVESALNQICAWAKRRRVPLVVKPHPVGTPENVRQLLADMEGGSTILVYRGNIHSAIRGARLVIVINSGTGFEALVHGKSVATLGSCDYQAATFAVSPKTLDAAWEKSMNHNPDRGYRFLLWYYRTRVFDIEDPECQNKIAHKVQMALNER